MSLNAVRAGRAEPRDRWFFTGMALLIAAIVAAGFGPSYAHSLAPPGLPVWVHLHGLVMVSWIALFIVQTWLIERRNHALHRRLGWAATGLVVAMVPLGIATDILAIRRGATPPFFTPAQMLSADTIDLIVFAGLFISGVRLCRRADWHGRLMLSGTVLLSWPAIGRLEPLLQFGLAAIIPLSVVVLILLALIGPAYDLSRRRRVHPAYRYAVGLIILIQPLHYLVAAMPPIEAFAARLDQRG